MARDDPNRRRRPGRRLLVDTEPQCLTVRNATATAFEIRTRDQAPPGIDLPPRAEFAMLGCLYDAAGNRLSLSQRPGGSLSLIARPMLRFQCRAFGHARQLPGRPHMSKHGTADYQSDAELDTWH